MTTDDRVIELEALVADLLAALHANNHQAVARVRALAEGRKLKKVAS